MKTFEQIYRLNERYKCVYDLDQEFYKNRMSDEEYAVEFKKIYNKSDEEKDRSPENIKSHLDNAKKWREKAIKRNNTLNKMTNSSSLIVYRGIIGEFNPKYKSKHFLYTFFTPHKSLARKFATGEYQMSWTKYCDQSYILQYKINPRKYFKIENSTEFEDDKIPLEKDKVFKQELLDKGYIGYFCDNSQGGAEFATLLEYVPKPVKIFKVNKHGGSVYDVEVSLKEAMPRAASGRTTKLGVPVYSQKEKEKYDKIQHKQVEKAIIRNIIDGLIFKRIKSISDALKYLEEVENITGDDALTLWKKAMKKYENI